MRAGLVPGMGCEGSDGCVCTKPLQMGRGAGYPHIRAPTHLLAWQSALQAPRMQDPLLLWEIPREALGSSGVLWGAGEGQVGGCRGCAKIGGLSRGAGSPRCPAVRSGCLSPAVSLALLVLK